MRWLVDEAREFWNRFDWLCILVLSWMIPMGILENHGFNDLSDPPYGYFRSLAFWTVPILFLLPPFLRHTAGLPGHRTRWALAGMVLEITLLGTVLDCFLGHYVFKFDLTKPDNYLGLFIPAVGMKLPVEEFLFYFLGALNIVLVYDWACRRWKTPEPERGLKRLGEGGLLSFSKAALLWAVIMMGLGLFLKHCYSDSGQWFPMYYTYLIGVGYGPAIFLYKSVRDRVNWNAFALTTLYTVGTSSLYEVGLAMPHHWWGYVSDGMIGKMLDTGAHLHHEALQPGYDWPFPLEAMMVWVVIPFACVLTFEGIKQFLGDPEPSYLGRLHPRFRSASDKGRRRASGPKTSQRAGRA